MWVNIPGVQEREICRRVYVCHKTLRKEISRHIRVVTGKKCPKKCAVAAPVVLLFCLSNLFFFEVLISSPSSMLKLPVWRTKENKVILIKRIGRNRGKKRK